MAVRSPRWVIAATILATHALVLVLLLASRRTVPLSATAYEQEQHLVYLKDFTPPDPTAASRDGLTPRPRTEQAQGSRVPAPQSVPGAAPAAPESPSLIDWDLEAEATADAIVRDLLKGDQRKCDDSPKRDPWLPPCKRSTPKFGWDPQEQRAGFSDGLPYVRLGRRCILVLGMIGCSVGRVPDANSHLLDHMKDPDRDRSSVPDIDDVDAPLGIAPLPQR